MKRTTSDAYRPSAPLPALRAAAQSRITGSAADERLLRSTDRPGYTSGVSSLRDRVASTIERATRKRALVSLPTETTIVEDREIPFIVHVGALQDTKPQAPGGPNTVKNANPFLPPDPDLVVCDVAPNHLCVLNKFNVIRDHLLIVTRGFEPQEAWLTVDDFTALLSCMHDVDGLGFYNAGAVAGASQGHKHLQLVPLPLGNGPRATPIDAVVDSSTGIGVLATLPELPFDHALIRLGDDRLGAGRANALYELYRRACATLGIDDEKQPYNLLLTRRWMLVVPRSREHWRRVSINALGFAGSLLVRNRSELHQLTRVGPLAALRSVVGPADHP